MANNPFLSMVHTIREDSRSQAAFYRMGTVISVNPLSIDVAGTIQDGSALLTNEMITLYEVGNRLLMLPIEDEQRYIIICKVVNV